MRRVSATPASPPYWARRLLPFCGFASLCFALNVLVIKCSKSIWCICLQSIINEHFMNLSLFKRKKKPSKHQSTAFFFFLCPPLSQTLHPPLSIFLTFIHQLAKIKGGWEAWGPALHSCFLLRTTKNTRREITRQHCNLVSGWKLPKLIMKNICLSQSLWGLFLTFQKYCNDETVKKRWDEPTRGNKCPHCPHSNTVVPKML